LGVAPGGNIGRDCAVFEAVHGSAPDIAGKGVANPTALLLSGIQMLQYMGLLAHAESIMDALTRTLAAGVKTRDLGGQADTMVFAQAVADNLRPLPVGSEQQVSVGRVTHPVPAEIFEDWSLVGADVFVEWTGMPPVPETFNNLQLKMISNRGTQVWPGQHPFILEVDHYRCRYVGAGDAAVTQAQLIELLTELDKRGIRWCHVEQLNSVNGQPRYSIA
jgi:isocitrate dehydrogenase